MTESGSRPGLVLTAAGTHVMRPTLNALPNDHVASSIMHSQPSLPPASAITSSTIVHSTKHPRLSHGLQGWRGDVGGDGVRGIRLSRFCCACCRADCRVQYNSTSSSSTIVCMRWYTTEVVLLYYWYLLLRLVQRDKSNRQSPFVPFLVPTPTSFNTPACQKN
eukprot:1119606-Rhodomonas_salina.5